MYRIQSRTTRMSPRAFRRTHMRACHPATGFLCRSPLTNEGETTAMPRTATEIEDDRLIRELLQNWAIWRDAGDWERFRTVWHPDGRMMATWTQGTGDEFIEISKKAWAKGVTIRHFLGGISVDLAGARAISQTKMTISQRAEVEGVLCDVLCTGRFYDFLDKRDGRWGIVLRQPIYEKDRMDPVTPGAAPVVEALYARGAAWLAGEGR